MTNIVFSINETAQVQLNLYDVLGRKIDTVFEGMAVKGCHIISLNGDRLGSGIYFIVLITNNGTVTQKITHLK